MEETCRKAYRANTGIGVTETMGNVNPANAEVSVMGQVYFIISFNGSVKDYYRELLPQPIRIVYKLAVTKEVVDDLMKLL